MSSEARWIADDCGRYIDTPAAANFELQSDGSMKASRMPKRLLNVDERNGDSEDDIEEYDEVEEGRIDVRVG